MTDTTRQDAWLEFISQLPADHDQAADLLHHWVMDTIRYHTDPSGYWQSPQQTLASGTGDCNDLAILWYASLRIYGIPPDKVRVAHVESALGPHMICVAKLDGGTLAFDNLRSSPVPWSQAQDRVIYMVNEQDAIVAGETIPTVNRQWHRVHGQLMDLDDCFVGDMTGA